jgi:hypothetical protein
VIIIIIVLLQKSLAGRRVAVDHKGQGQGGWQQPSPVQKYTHFFRKTLTYTYAGHFRSRRGTYLDTYFCANLAFVNFGDCVLAMFQKSVSGRDVLRLYGEGWGRKEASSHLTSTVHMMTDGRAWPLTCSKSRDEPPLKSSKKRPRRCQLSSPNGVLPTSEYLPNVH